MKLRNPGRWMLAAMLGTGCGLSAASNPIGVASGNLTFLVDENPVQGSATLFDGGMIETRSSSTRLKLHGGGELELGPASRGRVFRDRLVLEEGLVLMAAGNRAPMQVQGLQILPDQKDSQVRVALLQDRQVRVAALAGTVRVKTLGGALLATVAPGSVLEFEPQAATAAPPYSVEGCLVGAEGRFLLTDATTRVPFELRGENLVQYLGKYVQVTAALAPGAHSQEDAPQVLQVNAVKTLPVGCPVPSASQGGKAAEAYKTKVARGKTKAIVAGVAIATAAAATTVGLTGDEQDATISR